jgi:hypothetical protein
MACRISVLVKAVLASIAILLAALALSIAPGQATGLPGQADQAAVVVQAPHGHADGHRLPCHEHGASSDLRCCTPTHACGAALAEPQHVTGFRFLIIERGEYADRAMAAVNGVSVTPVLPPPRVAA